MRAIAAAALSLAALAASAQDAPKIPDPMPVDDTPTPFSCTLEKLLRGEKCLLEVDPQPTLAGPAQAQQNIAWAGAAAARVCAAAAVAPGEKGADEALRQACEKEVAQAAIASCGLDGHAALQDAGGRLGVSGRGCAGRLHEIVARTRAQAAVGLGCCRCLAASKCGPPLLQCTRELADLAPGAALSQCLERTCGDSCSFVKTPGSEETPAAASRGDRPQRRAAPDKI